MPKCETHVKTSAKQRPPFPLVLHTANLTTLAIAVATATIRTHFRRRHVESPASRSCKSRAMMKSATDVEQHRRRLCSLEACRRASESSACAADCAATIRRRRRPTSERASRALCADRSRGRGRADDRPLFRRPRARAKDDDHERSSQSKTWLVVCRPSATRNSRFDQQECKMCFVTTVRFFSNRATPMIGGNRGNARS